MITPKFFADVKDGILVYHDMPTLKQYLLSMKGVVEVIIRRPKKNVSDPQRGYLFGVAYKLIGDHVGMTPEEVHYSEPMTKLRMDYTRKIPTPKSVSRKGMSTQEFNEYKLAIQMWAADFLGVNIPDPNEVDL